MTTSIEAAISNSIAWAANEVSRGRLYPESVLEVLATEIANVLESHIDKFDRDAFLENCCVGA